MTQQLQAVLGVLVVTAMLAIAGGTTASLVSAQPACSWGGVWETAFLDETGGEEGATLMQLNDRGQTVTGAYDFRDGVIAGVVAGPVLSGSWMQGPSYRAPDDLGEFEFTIAADCASYAGRWRYAGDTVWSTWVGQHRPLEGSH